MAKSKKAVTIPATTTEVVATPTPVAPTYYTLGDVKATPRVDHNKVAWSKVVECLTANGGKATQDQILEALKDLPKISPLLMLAYLDRSHWLKVVKAEEPVTQ
jgi:hypothetical protein